MRGQSVHPGIGGDSLVASKVAPFEIAAQHGFRRESSWVTVSDDSSSTGDYHPRREQALYAGGSSKDPRAVHLTGTIGHRGDLCRWPYPISAASDLGGERRKTPVPGAGIAERCCMACPALRAPRQSVADRLLAAGFPSRSEKYLDSWELLWGVMLSDAEDREDLTQRFEVKVQPIERTLRRALVAHYGVAVGTEAVGSWLFSDDHLTERYSA